MTHPTLKDFAAADPRNPEDHWIFEAVLNDDMAAVISLCQEEQDRENGKITEEFYPPASDDEIFLTPALDRVSFEFIHPLMKQGVAGLYDYCKEQGDPKIWNKYFALSDAALKKAPEWERENRHIVDQALNRMDEQTNYALYPVQEAEGLPEKKLDEDHDDYIKRISGQPMSGDEMIRMAFRMVGTDKLGLPEPQMMALSCYLVATAFQNNRDLFTDIDPSVHSEISGRYVEMMEELEASDIEGPYHDAAVDMVLAESPDFVAPYLRARYCDDAPPPKATFKLKDTEPR